MSRKSKPAKPELSIHLVKDECEIYRCSKCGLLFVPYVESEKLERLYQQFYKKNGYYDEMYLKDSLRRTLTFKRWSNIIHRYKSGGRLLDVGTSFGEFLRIAGKWDGWELFGVEIDPNTAHKARKNSGANISVGRIENQNFPENYFDVITAWEVIEHISDVSVCLRRLRSWLKPDGILCLSTPNLNKLKNRLFRKYREDFFKPPEHLLYLNRRSLRIMMSKAGYEVLMLDAGIKSPLYVFGLYNPDIRLGWVVSALEWIIGLGQFVGIEGFQIFAILKKIKL